jgi:non-specific serine/threonine protein kinase/serine/threonine-protein kinase
MLDSPFEREQEIFQACLDLPPSERQAHLDETCPGDSVVRARIERLLAAHERAERATLHPLGPLSLDLVADHIGPYRLTGVLGEGGMGIVYDAEQQQPVQRRVALKVLKLGMDTREVIARFMAERQALAAMDHPAVAKVFDAGHTVAGRPYFVMERVEGVPLLEYCDREQLSILRRVELVAQVCRAVQHAHQKGVIHRDLKPSNVLVTLSDGAALPKIIDFGIAKAAGLDAPWKGTELTRVDQMLGTPAYMSPEQAGRGGQDVDTRTDVYSLGVMLYELLTGQLPAEPAETGATEFLAALAQGDVRPAKPSARVGTIDAKDTALRRSTTPAGLRRQLAGDLDWICMKALETDRNRRYETPLALADDLRRHLTSEPVMAGPPSRTYRLRRLVRRHRTTMAAATVAVVALLTGSAAAVTQAVRATEAEQSARADAETARQVSDFLINLFEVSEPGATSGGAVTARELLDQGAARIRGELEAQPLVRARVQAVIGEIYRKLGLYDPAGSLLEEALSAREQLLESSHVEVVQTLHSIGRLQFDRGDRAGAEATFRDALSRLATATQPDRIEEARLQCELGQVLRDNAKFAEAEALFLRAIDTLTRELGPAHEEVGLAWGGLGSVFHTQGRFEDAEVALRNSIANGEKVLSPDHPELAVALANLANTLGRLGRDDEAEPLHNRVITILEKAYGPDHIAVAVAVGNLAGLYGRQGRLDLSEATTRKAFAIRERIFGPDHPNAVIELKNLGLTLMLKADYEGARQAFERNLEVEQKAFGAAHPRVAWTEARLGGLYLRLGRLDAAEAAYQRALAATEKTLDPDHIDTVGNVRGLGQVALRRGRLDEADAFFARAMASSLKTPSHPDVPNTLKALGELRRRQGRLDEARASIEQALARQREVFRVGHPAIGETLVLLADVLAGQRDPAEAERLYREAATIAEKALGPDHPDVARALHGLGAVLAGDHSRSTGSNYTARRSEALDAVERALAIRVARLGDSHTETRETARLRADLRNATAH